MLTISEVERALPVQLRMNITQEFVDKINAASNDPLVAENIQEGFITYATVLKEGKFKMDDYLSAITYVSHKLMGLSNKDSYIKTFPGRYQVLVAKNTSNKDISAYVAAYHSNKLVNTIMEQSLIPCWLLNQSIYQKAINVQLGLMTGAHSEKVRTDAANSLLVHLKKPETAKVQLDLTVKENGGINELTLLMRELAERQLDLIQRGGLSSKQIAQQPLVIDMDRS